MIYLMDLDPIFFERRIPVLKSDDRGGGLMAKESGVYFGPLVYRQAHAATTGPHDDAQNGK